MLELRHKRRFEVRLTETDAGTTTRNSLTGFNKGENACIDKGNGEGEVPDSLFEPGLGLGVCMSLGISYWIADP